MLVGELTTWGVVADTPIQGYIDTNTGINANVTDDEPNTILMVHGWPALWSTWARQIQAFENDYRLLIPDLRGFGQSTHPGDVKGSGTMQDIVGDLVCVLENAGVVGRGGGVVCMGHDWGSSVCYEAARQRPDIFTAVIGIAVPYIPSSGSFTPTSHLLPAFPKLAYQIYFDTQTADATAELDADKRRSLRAVYRTAASPPPDGFLRDKQGFLGAFGEEREIPGIPFLTREEEDYLVEQFEIQGFQHTLQFYTTEVSVAHPTLLIRADTHRLFDITMVFTARTATNHGSLHMIKETGRFPNPY
ncbi:hypothetical protein AX17_004841 [Amanita inopinata Kibby_2008]|nr:hypothetical protein AX17_004841 [Amanita inopinata Kibby_2008]